MGMSFIGASSLSGGFCSCFDDKAALVDWTRPEPEEIRMVSHSRAWVRQPTWVYILGGMFM